MLFRSFPIIHQPPSCKTRSGYKFINFILTALLAVLVATLPSCSSLAVGAEDVSGQVTAAVMPQDVGGLLGALVAERSGSTSADDDTSAPEETTGESADDSVAADDTVTTDNDTAADSTTSDDEPTADETTGEAETTPSETDDTTGTQPETTAEEPAPKTKQPYKSGDKVVYLTFDDGPTPGITEWILAMLEKYDAKATFFVLGKNVEAYPDLFRRIVDAGHKVGNHTYSHQKGWGMSLERYIEDVDFANDLIHSELFRPPYARITPAQARALSQRYKLVMWDVLSRDYSQIGRAHV